MVVILKEYAIETRTSDGKPSGQFWLKEADAKALATKICKEKGKSDTWINTMFPSAWQRFDVNREGKIEAIKGPMFIRHMMGNYATEGLSI